MSIEEQLKSIAAVLTELVETDRRIQARHEALAQTVELIGHDLQDLNAKVDTLTDRTIQAMDAINRLANIAADHDERIENLEDKN